MKTLLIRGESEPPPEVRQIVRAGSTEVHETDDTDVEKAGHVDRVVIWSTGEVEVRGAEGATRLRWPDEKDKLRMLLMTGG